MGELEGMGEAVEITANSLHHGLERLLDALAGDAAEAANAL